MNWHFDGAWTLRDEGRIVGSLRHDGTQYVDGSGVPLAVKYEEARGKVEAAAGKAKGK